MFEACRFLLSRAGATPAQLKQFSFVLRQQFLRMALSDAVQRQALWDSPAPAAAQAIAAWGVRRPPPPREGEGGPPGAAPPGAPEPFTEDDAMLLRYGARQVAACAVKESEAGRLDLPGLEACMARVQAARQLIESIAPVPAVDVPALGEGAAPARVEPFAGAELLGSQDAEGYAGEASVAPSPSPSDFLAVPMRCANLTEAIGAMIHCDNICQELWARCRESTTSARLALQQQAIALIDHLFAEVLPVPAPLDLPPDDPALRACVWRGGNPMTKEMQLTALQRVHRLMMMYAYAWQAVERPTRAQDFVRFLVASCMFCVFDAVARSLNSVEPLLLSELLWEDGGTACPPRCAWATGRTRTAPADSSSSCPRTA